MCKVLTALHKGHLVVLQIKSLARSYIWWPRLDRQIEDLAKTVLGVTDPMTDSKTD